MKSARHSKRIAAVLFDMDDTLIDWSTMSMDWRANTRLHLASLREYLLAEGHQPPDEEAFVDLYVGELIRSWDEAKKAWAGVYFGDVLKRSFDLMGLDTSRINMHEAMRAYDWQPIPGVAPFEDACDLLDSLRDQGYRIGLITNSMFPMWMRDIELRQYGLIDYFDTRITSGETGYMKPHPAIYRKALNALETPAERAVFVGDRPENDIAGANDSGMVSVLMSPNHLDRELNGIQPDYTINRLSELLPILGELEQK